MTTLSSKIQRISVKDCRHYGVVNDFVPEYGTHT
jgi:hypothetical protein